MEAQTFTGLENLDSQINALFAAGETAVVSSGLHCWTTYRVTPTRDGAVVTGSGRNDNESWSWNDCGERMRSEVQNRQRGADRFGSPAYEVFPAR